MERHMKKAVCRTTTNGLDLKIGRCERIRTFDPLHPMQVRYQAAPHTEADDYSPRVSPEMGFAERFAKVRQGA